MERKAIAALRVCFGACILWLAVALAAFAQEQSTAPVLDDAAYAEWDNVALRAEEVADRGAHHTEMPDGVQIPHAMIIDQHDDADGVQHAAENHGPSQIARHMIDQRNRWHSCGNVTQGIQLAIGWNEVPAWDPSQKG